jgi:glycosyltransferase involved in cell wall biosynthesis
VKAIVQHEPVEPRPSPMPGGRASSPTLASVVSVLTPSFGQARWLADNLRSVAAQTYPAVEHVVVDGGSTDGSVELLERSSRPGLIWRSEPDRGQSHALNKALEMSHGAIIGWLNSDDAYFGPTAIADAVARFDANPEIAVVYGHAVLVDGNGLVLQVLWTPPFHRALLRLHDFIVQPAAFMRRDVIGERLVDESYDYTMDYELWLRLSRHNRFERLDRVIAVDRHHCARKSYTLQEIGHADRARLRDRYGIAAGPAAAVARKAWKIASRLAGATVVAEASHVPVVFDAVRDGVARLLSRQVAVPRAWMSTGDEARSG